MKRFLAITLSFILAATFSASAQMTDRQVTDYLKSAVSSGKSQTQIQRELLSKGVTVDQLKRIKAEYESSQGNADVSSDRETGYQNPRSKRSSVDSKKRGTDKPSAMDDRNVRKKTDRKAAPDGEEYPEYDEMPGFEDEFPEDENLPMDRPIGRPDGRVIYGHDIFYNPEMSFEPNENTATPSDYRLGPGDELVIEIWGYNEASLQQTISPEGKINISQIGPIHLGGLTIAEASAKIKKALASKYASIGGDRPNSEVSITLGEIRTIQVNVMGEAKVPGTYRLSSFSTVFTALYRAGGVTETGSLRAIQVVRGGGNVATVDVYGYLFNGRSDSDIRLQEGDIIIVPPYVNLVDVQSGVKRPMLYELAEGETVADAITYAGGFSSDAHKDDVSVLRKSGTRKEVFTVTKAKMASTPVEDGDEINAAQTLDLYSNRLEIQGYVERPGFYQLGQDIKTVSDLVKAAGGLREDAFLARAIIQREMDDLSLETVTVPVGAIMSGKAADIKLANNDVLIISGIHELNDAGTLTINGQVANPDIYPFAENTSVEDLIVMAGGLLDGASMARVDVARRIMDVNGTTQSETLGQTFQFAIKDGLAVDGADEFILQPYDVVSVRKSPSYQEQKFVTVEGEVAFPGQYVIQGRNETMTDIIARAGGATPKAYLKGGLVVRKTNKEETTLKSATKRLMKRNDKEGEEMDEDMVDMKEEFTVGIEMDKAVANPHSSYDLTVREGDRIIVPEFLNTVSIQGTVMYPNVVQYISGKNLDYYINAAGGYGERAKRSKVYVVYMNGNVTRARLGMKIEPGCEIIVPGKGEKTKMSTSEILSIGTSTASLATMIATLVRLF